VGHKKHINFFGYNLKKGYPILIIFVHIFMTQPAIKWPLVFRLTQRMLLHYQGRTEETKYALKSTKKIDKISYFLICGHQQPINYKVCLLCSSTSTE